MEKYKAIGLLFCTLLLTGCANNLVSVYAENDSLTYGPPTDANYTNGIQVSITPKERYEPCDTGGYDNPDYPCKTESKTKRFINWVNFLEDKDKDARNNPNDYPRRLEYGFGQQMYTPDDISLTTVQELDRPFAGWLFGFLKIHNDYMPVPMASQKTIDAWANDRRNSVTLKVGMVGRHSYAAHVQRYWHKHRCDCTYPAGWHLQVKDEPGFVLAASHEDRLWIQELVPGWQSDLMWRGELSVGNVYTGADIGSTLRFGYNLPRGLTPITIGPTNLGTERFADSSNLSVYAIVGGVARLVARDIFLDGNTFRDSPHTVSSEPVVFEGQLGLGAEYGRWSLRVIYVHRSDQFETQQKAHRFGSIVIARSYD